MKKNNPGRRSKAVRATRELSLDEVRALADRQAKSMLGISASRLYQKLDQGELRGTLAEAHFSMMRHLLKSA